MVPALKSLAATALLLPTGLSHSWLECADWKGDTETFKHGDYDPAQCSGFPRPLDGGARGVGRQQFGQDIGMDKQTTRSDASAQCHVGPVSEASYGAYPMAKYKQGRTYTLAWPAKNHAAAECSNANIPDTGLKIFAKKIDALGGADPTFSELQETQIPASFSAKPAGTPYDEGWGVPHEDGKVDFEGFQKCPDFCSNTDKAFCHGDITIPANLPTGTYTMQWYWEFNPGQLYITCFDVEVEAADNTDESNAGGPELDDSGDDGNPIVSDPTLDGNCDVVDGTNMIDFITVPQTISSSTNLFTVQLCFAATTNLSIVVAALDSRTGEMIGKGYLDVPQTPTARQRYMSVQLDETPRPGTGTVILRAWSTEKQYYSQWQVNPNGVDIEAYELTRRETLMGVSDDSAAFGRPSTVLNALMTLLAIFCMVL